MSGSERNYQGVKGWLLLLCVCLAILDPMTIFISLMAVVDLLQPYLANDPALFRMVLVSGLCNICLMVYSMYTGLSLWRLWPHAVENAKRYLLILFHYSFLSMFFPQLFGISEKTLTEIYNASPLNNALLMLYATAWFFYVRKSKRVRATYRNSEPATTE
ncbi:MAG TPA: DUF2569 family protein [Syntrophorhabdaceae bacterium]|nr:DUF2569 family protein [Syntrophorhabdaceae bacterium]